MSLRNRFYWGNYHFVRNGQKNDNIPTVTYKRDELGRSERTSDRLVAPSWYPYTMICHEWGMKNVRKWLQQTVVDEEIFKPSSNSKWVIIGCCFRTKFRISLWGLSLYDSYHRVCNKIKMTAATSGTRTAYPSGASEFTPGFSGVRVTRLSV